MFGDLWRSLFTNNAIRCFRAKANTNRNQHRITRKEKSSRMFGLLSITAHYACLSLCPGLICLRYFEGETCNYFAKELSHRETRCCGDEPFIEVVLADSYENQSNSYLACHYALLFPIHRARNRSWKQRIVFLRNCQLKILQAINQNVYIFLCNSVREFLGSQRIL